MSRLRKGIACIACGKATTQDRVSCVTRLRQARAMLNRCSLRPRRLPRPPHPELEPASKVSVMKHIQSHPEDIFLPHSPKMAEEFENLVDSLIYHLLVYTDYEQKEESK